jgi:hypothetical protein
MNAFDYDVAGGVLLIVAAVVLVALAGLFLGALGLAFVLFAIVASFFVLALWLCELALHDAISNPFDFDLKD